MALKNRSVNLHQFAMIPRAEIPRSTFKMERSHKMTFDGGYLVPFFCEEILPGDSWNVRMTAIVRLATPIYPTMDNLHMETFWFFVPNRLVWTNWQKFCGEQRNPVDSIAFLIPQVVSANGGFVVGSIFDYMGLPTVGQVGAGVNVSVNCLPLRAYNKIFDDWFRDENLVNSVLSTNLGDGPDPIGNFALLRRGKRHDYFTSCLPWPQKGATAVSLPLGTSAPVKTQGTVTWNTTGAAGIWWQDNGANPLVNQHLMVTNAAGPNMEYSTTAATAGAGGLMAPANLYADLTSATAATINQLREAFQIQKLLERDARGGTRYAEIVLSHFGVRSPDGRLQRPEYLGGGHTPIIVNPVAQTSGTAASGTTTPLGKLAGVGTAVAAGHGFSQSFTEHGYVIGLVNVRADLSYQQGLRRMWSRRTRYDFYWPAFAMLGEQTVLNKEIYAVGSATGGITAGDQDMAVFGYQERWAEYRYSPSMTVGLFRSTSAGTLDAWHYAERFTSLPALNSTFIQDGTDTVIDRTVAVPTEPNFIFDGFVQMVASRPMPLFSVPGLIDHF